MKKISLIAYIALSLAAATGCQKQLAEDNPSGLTSQLVYTTPEGFESLVNAAYSYTRAWYGKEEGYNLTEMGSDLWLPGVDNRRLDLMLYNNLQGSEAGLSATEVFIERLWQRSYQAVNLCNAGIAGVAKSGMAPSLQKTREAELRFLRAFYYWHIVEQWGGVHFTTEPTEAAQTTSNRTPVAKFYEQIIADLNFAVENLPPTSTQWGRATKPAAEAFLSRIHLTRGNNQQALDLAKKVISGYSYALNAKYKDLWTMANATNGAANKEVIWAVNYTSNLTYGDLSTTVTNTDGTTTIINPDGHPRGGNNGHLHFCMAYERSAAGAIGMQRDVANGRPFARYMPTKFLLNLFDETKDARYEATFKQAWICNKGGTYDKKIGGNTIKVSLAVGDTAILAMKGEMPDAVEATKKYLVIDESKMYKADGKIAANSLYLQFRKFDDPARPSMNEVQSARDVFVLRLAEMYLVAAEAAFKLGRPADAAADINVIRSRAAQPGQTAAMQVSATDISLDFILDERAREFAGEQLRWFDLKRTGKLVERVRKYNPEAASFIKDYHVLRPIPQKQLDAVVNKTEFTQNEGYK
ncbi:RagB/SusD family nutrient uptake outer membrane protein [Paraflavisolibacter sp. H34]|uniref:RagB/SusD family nutrient uptake outer membrane protein n=1 Tax=Huijunlia imazamoxiresistens TaxID=3127457 RepID=UPI00301B4DB3